ncbi:protein of unknown function DUF4033 containing protein [Nitzschia inconspicua]|uniref:Beta-carotene isomerase D27-like C-terminal domain-containing protein n=1 Tax=Nitzschia inconspicua TaxID=303405 RepID=A0A9K3KW28_9STRA|nr:protein of unknown function DUF4033 containing protein [Nitzschia inconspicua]
MKKSFIGCYPGRTPSASSTSARHILSARKQYYYGSSTSLHGSMANTTSFVASTTPSYTRWVTGPDVATKPDYDNIHGPLGSLMDNIFMRVFRRKLAEHVGFDSSLPQDDYLGLIELTQAMNARYSNRTEVQQIAQSTLFSLFPSWLPGQFATLFSKPYPEFSSRMNAWATRVGGTWLMGECEINDVVNKDGSILKDQGLLVKRCRFLEESGCASICVNSCKIPTQNFFMEDMGLPLTMTPDYETYECQFSFGVVPDTQGELDARNTPCLSRCPTAGSMRKWHSGELQEKNSICKFMENES